MRILLCLFVLFVLGCSEAQPPAAPPATPPVAPQPVQPPATPPAAPQVAPPSKDWMTGYWDGYTGKWLGPLKWTVSDDYRNGHQIGAEDRRDHKPPRYPTP